MSIKCTNGTIKDSKKNTVNCNQLTDVNCFDDSYTYCNKLNTSQKIQINLSLRSGNTNVNHGFLNPAVKIVVYL